MLTREQLLDFATRYTAWLNKNPSDEETLSKLVSRDVSIPLPYPGSTPTFDGSLKLMRDLHSASPDIAFKIVDTCIDEVQSSITVITSVTGTHAGYDIPLESADCGVGSGLALRLRAKNSVPRLLPL